MSMLNPFALLESDDNEDPQVLLNRVAASVAAERTDAAKKAAKGAKPAAKPAPSPAAPAPAGRAPGGRGGRGGRGGYGGGRGGGSDYQGFSEPRENGRAFIAERQVRGEDGENRTSYDYPAGAGGGDSRRGRGRGRGYGRDGGRRPGREFDRASGTGRSGDMKRDGAGRGNWGKEGEYDENAVVNPVPEEEEVKVQVESAPATPAAPAEVTPAEGTPAVESTPAAPVLTEEEIAAAEAARKEKEEEEKQMTLDEYEKVLEEKRKAMQAAAAKEARVVEVDEELAKMTLKKKDEGEDIFIKLGGEKEKAGKKKDEEKDKPKTLNINDFLKPPEGQSFYYRQPRGGRGGRGGGRFGGGGRGAGMGVGVGPNASPTVLDQSQFPTLGGS